MMTVAQALELAIQNHRSGHLTQAEVYCRQILAVQPDHFAALYLLGITAHQTGRQEFAANLLQRVISLDPRNAGAHAHLAEVYRSQERIDEAITGFRRALDLDPNIAEACNNLGVALATQGRLDEAIAGYRRALQLQPAFAAAYSNLGNAYQNRNQLNESITCYGRAVELQPHYAEAWSNLGSALWRNGQSTEAIYACRRAIELRPNYAEAFNNLGSALKENGQLDEAILSFQRALTLRAPNCEAHYNLANALTTAGRLDEAIVAYRSALDLAPNRPELHSTLILTLQLHPSIEDSVVLAERQRWNQRVTKSLSHAPRPHTNARDPERRLRIGYVSPDFRNQVVGLNLRPLFQHHHHQNFEIFCYSGVLRPDSLTEEFRQCANHWRNTASLNNEELTGLIRQDAVDILVDLSQHTLGNRLPLFARQPAPVQASFAGYPEDTGLEAIQNRLSDRWLEGKEQDDSHNAETTGRTANREVDPASPILHLARLRKGPLASPRVAPCLYLLDSFWCYDPWDAALTPNALPALRNGFVSFGCLNNFSKINEPTLVRWSQVMRASKDSRLLLLCGPGSHRQRTLDVLHSHGIAPHRVAFAEPQPRLEYLGLYHCLDLILDTFPYNGHTTSLDALWMGVPVVSLAGDTPVSRAGLSQLSNLGMRELIAFTDDDYVRTATALADDLPRLAGLRATLRARMEASVIMNAPHFTRQIELSLREMWRRWCQQNG
jgi:predicted O-linked N-acetylglucosamine transferase (SPINDLY family)